MPSGSQGGEYIVVARRYRPRGFDELVGQEQVATALGNAITSNRVGHAYLFTGARGVGKTSAARIFAKCLNCPDGPTPHPDNESDICLRIEAGEDVDVLEIDGASNRGIDEIRQLRSNVQIRPSRARFKIYIIDEVHMLTTPAFNALLKTLEEPPEHVKFIFCTTDPEKIPITVLSRCQRFDFAPIDADAITRRLRQIVEAEGVEADEDALRLLSRRASGSMRDSQSLLEQLLSFSSGSITLEQVHAMLGTAEGGRLRDLLQCLVRRDAAGSLAGLDQAVAEGVDVGQLAEQLLGSMRDLLAAAVGCGEELLRYTEPADYPQIRSAAEEWGAPNLLAAIQILDHTLARMRVSTQTRTLVEVAFVRVCHLEDLTELSDLIQKLESGAPVETRESRPRVTAPAAPPPPRPEKKTEKSEVVEPPAPVRAPSKGNPKPQNASEIWAQALLLLEDMTLDFASAAHQVATSGPDHLVVSFANRYNLQACEKPERRTVLEKAVRDAAGRPIRLEFKFEATEDRPAEPPKPVRSRQQQKRERIKHPLVSQAMELFDAELMKIEESRRTDDPPRS